MTRSAWRSCLIALALEVPICIFLSIWGIKQFAFYLSESEQVAVISQHMWRVRLTQQNLSLELTKLCRLLIGATYSMQSTTKLLPSCLQPPHDGFSFKLLARTCSGCFRGPSRWRGLEWLLKTLGVMIPSSLVALLCLTSSTYLWWSPYGRGIWWEERFLWRRFTALFQEVSTLLSC